MDARTGFTLLIVAGLVALGLPAPAAATDTATVHLTVETHASVRAGLTPTDVPEATPGTGECSVQVPSGADGGAVLDAAVDKGCIAGWDYQEFDGARFVTSIDRLRAPGLTCLAFAAGVCDWWQFHVNGEPAGYGIDGYEASDGDENRWLYRNTIGDDTRPS
jgi:hypothetical protein